MELKSRNDFVLNEAKTKQYTSIGTTLGDILNDCKIGDNLACIGLCFALTHDTTKTIKLPEGVYTILTLKKYNSDTDIILTITSKDNVRYSIFGNLDQIVGLKINK